MEIYMSIKKKILTIYAAVGVLFALYGWLFGPMSYRGLPYNLGRGLVWPVFIFPEFGKLVSGIILLFVIVLILVFARNPNR
jgi:membrane-anchored glycerophosphoryl diester phosphodiesterase (GDPDase)